MSNKLYSNNTSGTRGVNWDKAAQAWEARILINRVRIRLGRFRFKFQARFAIKQYRDELLNNNLKNIIV